MRRLRAGKGLETPAEPHSSPGRGHAAGQAPGSASPVRSRRKAVPVPGAAHLLPRGFCRTCEPAATASAERRASPPPRPQPLSWARPGSAVPPRESRFVCPSWLHPCAVTDVCNRGTCGLSYGGRQLRSPVTPGRTRNLHGPQFTRLKLETACATGGDFMWLRTELFFFLSLYIF